MVMVEDQHSAQNRNANETQQARVGYNPDEQGDMTNVKRGNRSAGMDQMNLTVEQMQQPIKDLEDCNSRANAIHALVVAGGS